MFYLRENLQQDLSPQNTFDDILKLCGKTYRQVKNRHTFSIDRNNKTYFIKIHTGVGWKEIFKNLLRAKIPIIGAKNEWQAIELCKKLDINTMEIAGYGKKGINPAKQKSFLITDALQSMETLEDFTPHFLAQATRDDPLKQQIIKSMAVITRKLHRVNMTHHDLYICHFLIDHKKLQSNQVSLYLIDLHRAQYHSLLKRRYIIKDLAAIYFSSMDLPLAEEDLHLFMETYREKSISWILKNDLLFWKEVQQRAIKLYRKIHKKEPSL
ncbi:lipopolysaccharide core heptose(I) kinase RfaP [Candidatus Uabimicrobium sp. HlEnr_7]|uniref:lipopolysaccharide core heptose(I) kinase RfaP n=1 Tax=Candidatus Uabimicrobium helgolandensis TaxID=3095367 RepID=UPI003559178B